MKHSGVSRAVRREIERRWREYRRGGDTISVRKLRVAWREALGRAHRW